jgi:hypothetical protein
LRVLTWEVRVGADRGTWKRAEIHRVGERVDPLAQQRVGGNAQYRQGLARGGQCDVFLVFAHGPVRLQGDPQSKTPAGLDRLDVTGEAHRRMLWRFEFDRPRFVIDDVDPGHGVLSPHAGQEERRNRRQLDWRDDFASDRQRNLGRRGVVCEDDDVALEAAAQLRRVQRNLERCIGAGCNLGAHAGHAQRRRQQYALDAQRRRTNIADPEFLADRRVTRDAAEINLGLRDPGSWPVGRQRAGAQ